MSRKSGLVEGIDRLASGMGRLGSIGGSIMIALMTGLITVDVLGRFLLGVPTYIATEVSGYLMAALVFLGLARISRIGQQIEVTVIIDRLPAGAAVWIRFATLTAASAFIVWFCLLTIQPVLQNIDFRTTSITPLKTPMWIPTLFVPLGLALLVMELFSQWLRQAVNIVTFGRPYPDRSPEAALRS